MNKEVFVWGALVLSALAGACASLNLAMVEDTTKAGVIVELVTYRSIDDVLTIYLDNKEVGTLKYKDIKGVVLKNGIHTIYVRHSYRTQTDIIRFTVNNDRHHFRIEGDKARGKYSYWITSVNVSPVTAPPPLPINDNLFNTAINKSFNTISINVPKDSKVALVNIASPNQEDSSFILEELTVLLVNSRKFTVVDRQTLDAIRKERNFQVSGEVSDETMISIGQFIGADVVITGAVTGDGERRRLRLRGIDVKTAQVLAASSEKI
jgi:TolB-like protein